jgi:hypothetical protein
MGGSKGRLNSISSTRLVRLFFLLLFPLPLAFILLALLSWSDADGGANK